MNVKLLRCLPLTYNIALENSHMHVKSLWCLRACAHQKKFGEKMAGEIESEKGNTCIPMEVRTLKERLACVTAGSKAGKIVSRTEPASSMIPGH